MAAEQRRRLAAFLVSSRGAWILLGGAMAIAAALILYAADGETFDIDEYFYFGRLVNDSGRIVEHHSLSLGYLLAPYNGHLQLGGKLIYEALFGLAGTDYLVFELFNVAALCACVALVFELTRRRVGALTALGPCVLLLFFGFAREVLLWPFDLHTLVSLAAGLGAMVVLQRDDRRGDVLACALIVLSIATIELGLAVLAGMAIWILRRPDRWRRIWIVLVPLALFAAWWLWARRFDQSEAAASNLTGLLRTYFDALAAVVGSLTGTNELSPASYITTVTGFAEALAVLVLVAIAFRLRRGALPWMFWVWLAVLGAYWGFLAVAARPPEASRYLFVGAVGVLLVGAEALHGRVSKMVTLAVAIVVLVALPANVAQLLDERDRDTLHADAAVSRTDFAMVELARERVTPDYVVSADPKVAAAGGQLYIGIPAAAYLAGVERNGSLAYSLPELRRQPERLRRIADAALVGALALHLRPEAPADAERRDCATSGPAAGQGEGGFALPPGRTFLKAGGGGAVRIGLRRFASRGAGVAIARLQPGGWTAVSLPRDAASEPWRAVVDGPVTACPAS
jgi:hypothetical protein